jgi:integrase
MHISTLQETQRCSVLFTSFARLLETFMPRVHLTDITVRSLKPQARQIKYWDRATPGFGVRVNDQGTKSWVVMYGRKRTLKVLGRYPDMPLARARAAAKKLLNAGPEPDSATFDDTLELYLAAKAQQNRKSTYGETERILRKTFAPVFAGKLLHQIVTQQISGILDRLKPSAANHAFAEARMLFRWSAQRRFIDRSPLEGLSLPSKSRPRDRTLTTPELLSVWRAADRNGYPYGTIIKLLVLTGQRRNEITSLERNWIEGNLISFPPRITKNHRPHSIPFNGFVSEVLETVPRLNHTSLLFPARGNDARPFSGWSKSKNNLEKLPPIRPWTLHDLRRTFATIHASLGTPPHVVERLLNHVSGGAISGVAAIYNRFHYLPEMREAVARYEAYLSKALE